MIDTNQQNETTTYRQDTSGKDVHNGPAGATDQTKEALAKAADKAGEVYDKIAPTAQEAFDKTASTVNETYQHTREYSKENPGKSVLIALGIGIGIGFLWGSNTRHYSRGGRYARPIVNAVSDVAMEYFR